MGRLLKLRRNPNTKWGEDAEKIVESFVCNTKMGEIYYGMALNKPIPPDSKKSKAAFKNIPFSYLASTRSYMLGDTRFVRVGNSFGCREGLTRDIEHQEGGLMKDSAIVLRNAIPIRQPTYKTMFSEGWTDFLKSYFIHDDLDEEVIELFGKYSSSPAMISFPIVKPQKSTMFTMPSALVLLLRSPTVFCRDRGKQGLRNYREVIEELIRDKTGTYKSYVKSQYPRNTVNYILWNLLRYFDLLPSISKGWVGNHPNGPDNFVAYGGARITAALRKLKKAQVEEFFDLLGGKKSRIVLGFPTSIRTQVTDMAAGK